MEQEKLKERVCEYWNQEPCGTQHTKQQAGTLDYFEEIEAIRYRNEPEIFSFAQFTRFHGKKILEVGVGAGTDFLQWARAGADAHGIDLTQQAIVTTQKRLELYGLCASELSVADAEKLPYQDGMFDLVYSWGVIHHSPDTRKCLSELIRVTKPGGTIKVMIYNRHSLFALYRYLLVAFFKGKPFRSLKHVLYYDQESIGTKAFTHAEVLMFIKNEPVELVMLNAPVTKHDLLYYSGYFVQCCAYFLGCLFGWNRAGWFLKIELKKMS